jgi:uncharacterized protein YqgV (UPF0045/DUF77 family)
VHRSNVLRLVTNIRLETRFDKEVTIEEQVEAVGKRMQHKV